VSKKKTGIKQTYKIKNKLKQYRQYPHNTLESKREEQDTVLMINGNIIRNTF
jgi:hypothetical protein